jgi:hypothetical protein
MQDAPAAPRGLVDGVPVRKVIAPQQRFARLLGKLEMEELRVAERAVQLD